MEEQLGKAHIAICCPAGPSQLPAVQLDGMTHCTGSHRLPPNAAIYCYDALDRA